MTVPLFIIVFNRLWCLKQCFENAKKWGDVEIVFIDNGSNYFETRDWLTARETEGHAVYRMKALGGLADLYSNIYTAINRHLSTLDPPASHYILTDPDVVVPKASPGLLNLCLRFLSDHAGLDAVGPMMRFDDIPPGYPERKTVLKRYSKFCASHPRETWESWSFLRAPVDTTWALYRSSSIKAGISHRAARVMAPWMARHLDWYCLAANYTVDHLAYIHGRCGAVSHWSGRLKDKKFAYISIGQRCHTAMALQKLAYQNQSFPFDHCISRLEGVAKVLVLGKTGQWEEAKAVMCGGMKLAKIPDPTKRGLHRRVFSNELFAFPHHRVDLDGPRQTHIYRLRRLMALISMDFPCVFVRSVLDPDEYSTACHLMDEFPTCHIILVVHRAEVQEGLWSAPHPRVVIGNVHGLVNEGPGSPWHPTQFSLLSSFNPETPLDPPPDAIDLGNLEQDVYLGSAVAQTYMPLAKTFT